jgi:hypothetical protein
MKDRDKNKQTDRHTDDEREELNATTKLEKEKTGIKDIEIEIKMRKKVR